MASAYVKIWNLSLTALFLSSTLEVKEMFFLPSKASVLKGLPISLFRKCCRLLMMQDISYSVRQMFPLAGGAAVQIIRRENFSRKICFLALYFFLLLRII